MCTSDISRTNRGILMWLNNRPGQNLYRARLKSVKSFFDRAIQSTANRLNRLTYFMTCTLIMTEWIDQRICIEFRLFSFDRLSCHLLRCALYIVRLCSLLIFEVEPAVKRKAILNNWRNSSECGRTFDLGFISKSDETFDLRFISKSGETVGISLQNP